MRIEFEPCSRNFNIPSENSFSGRNSTTNRVN